jgi:putative MATE family efflux protein
MKVKAKNLDLTKGSIVQDILIFTLPILLGQLLQQLYNLADAWVVGNFADNDAFAAVSSGGSLTFLVIGFFNGIAIGGGVIISRYFGAGDESNVERAIHTNFLFGILASILSTVIGLLLTPHMLVWMNTPDSVMPSSLAYFRIYFAGVATVIMYNICMSIMRSLGDSVHPLYYLASSSVTNVVLDLLFVAVFHWGVAGAAIATVFSQGLSCVLCIIRMCRIKDYTRLNFSKLKFYPDMMKEVIAQGLPTGVQNSMISIGNLVVQSNINAFGAYAMSGHGAYSKIEGVVFLPITCMSMALPTFIGQNLGAREYKRAKKGALFGILFGVIFAEVIGFVLRAVGPTALRFFTTSEEAIQYGIIQIGITYLFFGLLAFSHCSAGVLRGCGKAVVPMITMLTFWCGVRILYVTVAIRIWPVYNTIAWAYPLTWSLSSIVFLIFLLRSDWTHAFEKKEAKA